ncbi:DUF3618 domain-containing protein [Streptomyces sp. NPDC003038]|uniref:DUF3618 domain-containing protein n=1 Tax=Streptomyces sp. NPDC003038 TaxID=3154546 RepID=UPI0033AA0121
MGATPEELRNDLEYRRAHLARNVDLLTDRVTPRKVARRKAGNARHRLTTMKEQVMGTAQETAHGVADSAAQATGSVTETAKDTAGQIGEAVQNAPAQLKRQTQGSPLGAGLMAFGAGMLAAALLPTTEAEERLGQQLREHSDELVEPVKQTAMGAVREVQDELREPAAQAVEAVKSSAQEAAQSTKEQAQTAGRETAEGMREVGQDTVREVRGQDGDPSQRGR